MNDKKIFSSNIACVLLVNALCFAFTYFIWGFYYVEYEGLHDALLSGKLTPGVPFSSFYFLFNIGLTKIYSDLYTIVPNIAWIAYIYYLILFFSTSLALWLLVNILPNTTSFAKKSFFILCIYFLLFADQNIHFLVTRVSYICSGVSLFALIVLFKEVEHIRERLLLFILLNTIFTLGTLTRLEPSIATFPLMAAFGLLYITNIKKVFLILLYPALLITLLSVAIFVKIENSTAYHINVEPEIETEFLDKAKIVPLSSMKTKKDSCTYAMARAIFWSDPKVLSPSYLRSLIQTENKQTISFTQCKRSLKDILNIVSSNRHLVLLSFLLGCLMLLMIWNNTSQVELFLFFVFEFSFWVLVFLQTYTIKINDRSFVPLLDLYIFCHIYLILKRSKRNSLALFTLIGLLLFISFFNIKWLTSEVHSLNENFKKQKAGFFEIQQIAKNNIVVINSTAFDCFFLSNTPFRSFDFTAFKRVYISDGHVIPFIPSYNRYLQQECSCNLYDYPVFWKFLLKNNAKVYIVSTPEKMNVIKNYLQTLYQLNLNLQEQSLNSTIELKVYTLNLAE